MGLTLADLQDLRSGWVDPVRVGVLPPDVVQALGWSGSEVYLSSQSLRHIVERHPDMDDFELCLVSLALADGLIIAEAARPNTIVIGFQHPERPGRRFKAVLKRSSHGPDIWLVTFHRSAARRTRALLKRGRILQLHK